MKLPQNNKGLRFGQLLINVLEWKLLKNGIESGDIENELCVIPDKQLEKLLTNYLDEDDIKEISITID